MVSALPTRPGLDEFHRRFGERGFCQNSGVEEHGNALTFHGVPANVRGDERELFVHPNLLRDNLRDRRFFWRSLREGWLAESKQPAENQRGDCGSSGRRKRWPRYRTPTSSSSTT